MFPITLLKIKMALKNRENDFCWERVISGESCQFWGGNVGEGEMAGILGKLRMLCRCLLDELTAPTIPIVTVASNPQNWKLRLL